MFRFVLKRRTNKSQNKNKKKTKQKANSMFLILYIIEICSFFFLSNASFLLQNRGINKNMLKVAHIILLLCVSK